MEKHSFRKYSTATLPSSLPAPSILALIPKHNHLDSLAYEKKNDFRKGLKDLGYRIENSKKDGNQVYIFNARIAEMKE